jgi:hypothetical protein
MFQFATQGWPESAHQRLPGAHDVQARRRNAERASCAFPILSAAGEAVLAATLDRDERLDHTAASESGDIERRLIPSPTNNPATTGSPAASPQTDTDRLILRDKRGRYPLCVLVSDDAKITPNSICWPSSSRDPARQSARRHFFHKLKIAKHICRGLESTATNIMLKCLLTAS